MNVINTGVLHKKGELLSKIYSNYFDKILVDAPCSGLGIIQKKEEVLNWWNENKVKSLAELQLKLLVSAVKMCKPGGEIVYSTCTLTREENEQVISKLISKYLVETVDITLPVISHYGEKEEGLNNSVTNGKRIFPWETDTDGFFIIKLRKTAETESSEQILTPERQIRFFSSDHREINKRLESITDYFGINKDKLSRFKFFIKNNDIHFVNEDWVDEKTGMFNRIGLKLGSVDRAGEIVLHSHAAQILGGSMTEKIIGLSDQGELKIYLEGGLIKNDSLNDGQYVVRYDDYILGTAVVTKSGIKSRFPRSKRTQEIYTDFLKLNG
jgi:16S rRNA (cytosine1407-C5)-methyltransferase